MRKIYISIRTKLIVLFILFVCVPLIVFGKLGYDSSTLTIEKSAVNFNEQIVRQINERLNAYFIDLERTTFPLFTHPLVGDFMTITPDQPFEQYILTRRIQEELLRQMMFGRPEIYSFTIFSNQGLSVSNAGAPGPGKSIQEYMDELRVENFAILGIHWEENGPLLTVARKFTEPSTYRTSGVLIMDLRLTEIAKIVSQIKLGATGFLWIADAGGQVIYHPDRSTWGGKAPAWYSEQIHNRESGVFIHSGDGMNNLIVYHKSNYTDWTIISQVPIHELTAGLITLRNRIIWVGIALVLLGVLVIGGFSLSLTNALHKLQRLMRQAERGHLNVAAPEHKKDEIGNLYRGFNKMVSELRRLIEEVHTSQLREKELVIKQRESKIQVLQSQINPHFLYNTLEMINSYAILEGVTPISRMAIALANLFRYSIGDSAQIVSLDNEINNIRTYLDIQKERFPKLEIVIDVDKAALGRVKCIRLMLQPLVENSFRHGYEKHRLKPAYIEISGEWADGHYLLRVIDHGKGMDEETLEQLTRLFTDAGYAANAEGGGLSLTNVGLRNVHERIRLVFDAPYGLRIVHSDLNGTCIEITLPMDEAEKTERISEA